MAAKSTLDSAEIPAVPHWEKRILYAYLRMMGSTQASAGSAVGRSRRTVQLWEENKPLFAQAREEARKRWLVELGDVARVALLQTIKAGNGVLALQVLERMDSELSTKQQIEVSGTVKVVRLPQKAPSAEVWQQGRLPYAPRGTDLGSPTEAN
jgi:hypothetical protein